MDGTHLDKHLVQLQKRNHLARAPPPPVPKRQLGHAPHLGPLARPGLEPPLRPEHVGVGPEHGPVAPRRPEVGRHQRAAGHPLAVDRVALGRDHLEG